MFVSFLLFSFAFGMFLGGMWTMRNGLENLAMNRLPYVLRHFVKTPTRGMITGILTTMMLQSSAAVMLITLGLVSARQMAFADSIGIILGSNVGTSITVQLLALQLEQMIVPVLLLGLFFLLILRGKARYFGIALLGFASMLFAMELMAFALKPLGQTPWFRHMLTLSAQHPLLGVLTGTLLTALVQSSTATTTLTIALAADGYIALPGSIAIVLGNNIGTCVTSVLASIGGPLAAQRAAAAHVMLNVLGVLVFLPFLWPFATLIQWLSPSLPVQVALAHTLFNLLSSLAVWPIARPFARFIELLLRGREIA